jgi:hypothetical protein
MIRKILLFVLVFLPLFAYSKEKSNVDYERAMEFSKKYQLSETNTNIADVNYAREFGDVANEKLVEKYKNLGANQQDMSRFEDLNKMQKIMDKNPNVKKDLKTHSEKKPISSTREDKVVAKTVVDETKTVVNESQEYEVRLGVEEVVIVEDEQTMIDVIEIEEEKEQQEAFIQNIMFQNKILDRDNLFTSELKKIEKKAKNEEENQLTIFYFASSDLNLQQFNNFISHIDKLKNKGYSIVGRVLFRGLIDDSFDGIANWLRDKEDKGMKRSPNVHYQFHPWAFDYFSLDKVPAYALSNCKSDFRFKECSHHFLAKGSISFERFTEILKENYEKEFNNLYLDTIDINEVIYENN